jgi:putative endopeptidase
MDRSVDPSLDFYTYAVGGWIRSNPVPADKSRWGGFGELSDRNFDLIHQILTDAAARRSRSPSSVSRQVGDFFVSATDVRRRDALGLRPIAADLVRIERIRSTQGLVGQIARDHDDGLSVVFDTYVGPDKKATSTYALYAMQGGLSLPDREYYLAKAFAPIRKAYRAHIPRLLARAGVERREAAAEAETVFDLETELAKASRTRTELRDELKNYHKQSVASLDRRYPTLRWKEYLARRKVAGVRSVIVGQPEYFEVIDRLLRRRPLSDWKVYLRWRHLHAAAPYLDSTTEAENFRFFHRVLLGQREPEPSWRRAARVIDRLIGEALGQLYVERHFPPEARRRAQTLVDDVKSVFRDRLAGLPWMTPATRRRALQKFKRFTTKIGHPDRFRDYSSVRIDPADYLGNVKRATQFDIRRDMKRIGGPVDRTEWGMTPPTVNAYFDATQNEIVFPAGILQPPFFDVRMDDAVNYGAIGVVIGHEITHGYDDRGRKHDADGNLVDWWTARDAKEFERRASRVVREYDAFEALPGVHVNGQLTLGENIADFGGVSLAFEALQRRLAREPKGRRPIDGFTPEQRFFLSYAQTWRENCREPERRRLLTIDPHSPGRFRAIGPITNVRAFYDAFGIRKGSPMWRSDASRVTIW